MAASYTNRSLKQIVSLYCSLMKSAVMPEPNSLRLLFNNDSWHPSRVTRLHQSIVVVLSAAISVLKTSSQKWLRLHNLASPDRNHCSLSEKQGVDLFGPFFIVNGRETEKQNSIILNCLVTCAWHLESCSSMTTDSFRMPPLPCQTMTLAYVALR